MATNMTAAPRNLGWKQSIYNFHNNGVKRLGKTNSFIYKALWIHPHHHAVLKIVKLASIVFTGIANLVGRASDCFRKKSKRINLKPAQEENGKKRAVDPAPIGQSELKRFEVRVERDSNQKRTTLEDPIQITQKPRKTEKPSSPLAERKPSRPIAPSDTRSNEEPELKPFEDTAARDSDSKEKPFEKPIPFIQQLQKSEELSTPAKKEQFSLIVASNNEPSKDLQLAAQVNSFALISPTFIAVMPPPSKTKASNALIPMPNPNTSTALVPQANACKELILAEQTLGQIALFQAQKGVVTCTKAAVALAAANECLHAGIIIQSAAAATSVATTAGLAVQLAYVFSGGAQAVIGLTIIHSLYKGDTVSSALYNGITAPLWGTAYAAQSMLSYIKGSKEQPLALPAPKEPQAQVELQKGFVNMSPRQAEQVMANLTKEQLQALQNGESLTVDTSVLSMKGA